MPWLNKKHTHSKNCFNKTGIGSDELKGYSMEIIHSEYKLNKIELLNWNPTRSQSNKASETVHHVLYDIANLSIQL